jgi:hypothetical protein
MLYCMWSAALAAGIMVQEQKGAQNEKGDN